MRSSSLLYSLALLGLVLFVSLVASRPEGGHGFVPKRQHKMGGVAPTVGGNNENCTLEVDLMIAIDGSSSITDDDWQNAVAFLYDVVLGFQIGANGAQVGVVQFTTQYETVLEVPLTDDVSVLQKGLQNLQQIGGGTNIAEGIIVCQTQITKSGRSGVPHVIIVITDGQQDDPGSNLNPVTAAGNAKLAGSILFGVGVGNQVDVKTMEAIVNTPYQEYYFSVNSYQNLSSILQKTVLSICHSSTTTAASAASATTQSSQSTQSQSSSSQTSQTSQTSQSSSGTQSGTTGGGTKCGNFNTCPFGDFCCSDGNNPNDPFYCCAGADRCCEGACCSRGYQCYNGQCIGGLF